MNSFSYLIALGTLIFFSENLIDEYLCNFSLSLSSKMTFYWLILIPRFPLFASILWCYSCLSEDNTNFWYLNSLAGVTDLLINFFYINSWIFSSTVFTSSLGISMWTDLDKFSLFFTLFRIWVSSVGNNSEIFLIWILLFCFSPWSLFLLVFLFCF